MRLILLGAPGAGKGTQAALLAQALNIPKIGTGDMLRAAGKARTELGLAAQKYMDAGRLVPDDIIIKLAIDRIQEADCQNGFIFDGFPRTIAQAQALTDLNIELDYVIEIFVPDEEIIERLSGRRIHLPSGRIYHKSFHPPRREGYDDITGEALIQREDDKEATVRKRLEVYYAQTAPLVDYYQHLYEQHASPVFYQIDGMGEVDEIQARLLTLVGEDHPA